MAHHSLHCRILTDSDYITNRLIQESVPLSDKCLHFLFTILTNSIYLYRRPIRYSITPVVLEQIDTLRTIPFSIVRWLDTEVHISLDHAILVLPVGGRFRNGENVDIVAGAAAFPLGRTTPQRPSPFLFEDRRGGF